MRDLFLEFSKGEKTSQDSFIVILDGLEQVIMLHCIFA